MDRKKVIAWFVTHKQELVTLSFVFLAPLVISGAAFATHEFEDRVMAERRISAVSGAFENDTRDALDKTRAAAHSRTVIDAITANDSSRIIDEFFGFLKQYRLSAMMAVNREGVVVVHVPSLSKGDLVFQTTPWGGEVAQGKEVVTIGEDEYHPLVLNSAVPIIEYGAVQGAVVGGYVFDGAHAKGFKEKYLNPEEEIAFYSVRAGIYGDSFGDLKTERLTKAFFSDGSEAVQGGGTGLIEGHFEIADTVFHVANIKLTNIDGLKVGGILIFMPVYTGAPFAVAGFVGFVLLVPLFFRIRKKHQSKRFQVIGIAGTVVLVVGSMSVYVRVASDLLYQNPPPYTIYNSTMAFSPGSNIFRGTASQKINIQIMTGGEEINAAQAFVKYDPTLVSIEDIVTDHSFCDSQFIVQKTIDNKKGEAVIACGKLGSFSGGDITLAELVVRPLRPGRATLEFTGDTSVLASDGFGTDVLRTATNGSYQFIAASSSDATGGTVPLFSYSHPNSARWYNSRYIHINWINPGEYKNYAYTFDQQPDTIPDGARTTNKTSVDLVVREDGVYYFHLVPIIPGHTAKPSHFRILVDTTPPILPKIQASAALISAGDTIRLKFSDSGDNRSGLQKNFYVRLNKGTWFPTATDIDVPFLRAGRYQIGLRVFDNAGNYSDASTEITVE